MTQHLSEVAQQEAGRVQQRVAAAAESLMSAHTAAARLVGLGGPDYRPAIAGALAPIEGLSAEIGAAVGEVEPHRGQRTPPVCGSEKCPVHGSPMLRPIIGGPRNCPQGK